MFSDIIDYADDPIEGFQQRLRNCERPDKLDLGLGIYRDEQNQTVVFDAVRQAEARIAQKLEDKAYRGPVGNAAYIEGMEQLMFGKLIESNAIQGVVSIQTPGCGAACRVGAEYIYSLSPKSKVWASQPNWSHQLEFFSNAGLEISYFPYYDLLSSELLFEDMLQALNEAQSGDVVLLHGCCHNPTGQDLSLAQWDALADLCSEKGLIPFVDIAYQGFGDGIDEDLAGMHLMAAKVPEMIVAVSSSKSFTIYRERAGLLSLVFNDSVKHKSNAHRMLRDIARGVYFMPPDYGAEIVGTILSDDALTQNWRKELDAVRVRIHELRNMLRQSIEKLSPEFDGEFLENQKGMFSCLPLTAAQQDIMEREFGIFMLPNARINFAALAQKEADRVANAFVTARA